MIKKNKATRGKEQNDQGNKKKITIRKEQGLNPPISIFSLETTNPQDPPPPLTHPSSQTPPLADSTNELGNIMCTRSQGGTRKNEKKHQGNKKKRNKMTRENTQLPSPPLAHGTKEMGNKKIKEQEEQGHKMTRGNKKKIIP